MFWNKKRIHIVYGHNDRILGASMNLKKAKKILIYNHGKVTKTKVVKLSNFTRTFYGNYCKIVSVDFEKINEGIYICSRNLEQEYKVFNNYAEALKYINQVEHVFTPDEIVIDDTIDYNQECLNLTEFKEGYIQKFKDHSYIINLFV